MDVGRSKHEQAAKLASQFNRPRVCHHNADVVPSLFNPLSSVDRDLRADLHADHFARRPQSINQVREASSGSAPCIKNTIPWGELKKLHCSLPQRLYEKDVKIWEGTDQTNQASGIRRGGFAIVHRVYFFFRFTLLCSSAFNNRVSAKKLSITVFYNKLKWMYSVQTKPGQVKSRRQTGSYRVIGLLLESRLV